MLQYYAKICFSNLLGSANCPLSFDPNSDTISHYLNLRAKTVNIHVAVAVLENVELIVVWGNPIAGGVYTAVSPTWLEASTL
jgi:hypothetical protein